MEWLSRSLNKALSSGMMQPYNTLHRAIKITHLLFADDVLLFANGNHDSIKHLLDTLNRFCAISGETLNPAKSQIIFSSHHTLEDRARLCNITNFADTSLPITYLGAPLYKGRTLVSHFQFLITRVRNKIMGWAKKLISMGGRVELIRSVLCAIGTHCMLTLPVPITVIDNMVSLMSSFLWDAGHNHRRHWISWDRVCSDKDSGGLGIRHPKHMMLALHGKRAWDLLVGSSLWARFARSRFKVGRPGSPLWNAISPLLVEVKKLGSWRIGNGSTLGADICNYYGVACPSECSRRAISEIISNDSIRWSLIGVLPPEERDLFRHITLTPHPDRYVCKLTTDGSFTTQAYHKHLFPSSRVAQPWSKGIWKTWIPPKISCFVWKLFHKVVPTDDTIMRLTIPLPSKCLCCKSPSVETMEHLFFLGDMASAVWEKFSAIFDKPRPRGRGSFMRWLQLDHKSFLNHMTSGMACCVVWEIWKARNNMIHGNRHRPLWDNCIGWAARIGHLITAPYHPSHQADLTLLALKIRSSRPNEARPSWFTWSPPPNDLVIDIAIHASELVWRASGIVRSANGTFITALRFNHPGFDAHTLVNALTHFRTVLGDLCHRIILIRSSDSCFWHFSASVVPAAHRRCMGVFPNASFRRTNPCQNIAASCFLYTSTIDACWHLKDLPLPVRRAIFSDRSGLPTTSSTIPLQTQEDHDIPRNRYRIHVSNDY